MSNNQPFKIEQNIRKKVLWPLGIVILASFSLFIFVSDYFMEIGMARLQETHLQTVTTRYHSYMLERTGLMRSILQQLSRDPAIIEALDRRDRTGLLQHSTPLYKELLAEQNITHFYYHTPAGENLLRVHKPDRHGDQINRVTMHAAQRKNEITDGIELGPLGTFTLRVVMPIHDQARLVGFLELGEDIGPIIEHLSSEGDDKIAVLILKQLVDKDAWIEGRHLLNETANWDLLPDHVVSGVEMSPLLIALPQITTVEALSSVETVQVMLSGKIHQGRFLNMMDVGGRTVGSWLVLQDVHEIIQNHNKSTLLIATFCCLLAVTLFWIASNILGRADRNLRLINDHLSEDVLNKEKSPNSFKLNQTSDNQPEA